MLHQETNDYGVISVDNTFLYQLIKDSLRPYEGKVYRANYKGRTSDFIIKLGNIESLADQEVRESERGIYIKIYLMVRFGISMGTMAKKVIDNIAETLINDLGLQIDDIVIVITGLFMTKGIAKRHIVYTYKQSTENTEEDDAD